MMEGTVKQVAKGWAGLHTGLPQNLQRKTMMFILFASIFSMPLFLGDENRVQNTNYSQQLKYPFEKMDFYNPIQKNETGQNN